MKKLAFAALALGLSMGAAHAADLIIPSDPIDVAAAAHDWNGFYAGVIGGWGSGNATYSAAPAPSIGLGGWLVGGTLGYNYHWDMFVIGLEGDLAAANLAGTAALGGGVTLTSNVNWVGTVRGRAGMAFDSFLVYATAGVAAGNLTSTAAGTPGATSHSATKFGWTAGVGAEAFVTDDISLKAEYAYTDLGTNTIPAGALATGSAATNATTNFHAVKIGANFHF